VTVYSASDFGVASGIGGWPPDSIAERPRKVHKDASRDAAEQWGELAVGLQVNLQETTDELDKVAANQTPARLAIMLDEVRILASAEMVE
jgi:hypothetical protein